jgi:hypothetical protein
LSPSADSATSRGHYRRMDSNTGDAGVRETPLLRGVNLLVVPRPVHEPAVIEVVVVIITFTAAAHECRRSIIAGMVTALVTALGGSSSSTSRCGGGVPHGAGSIELIGLLELSHELDEVRSNHVPFRCV